MTNGTVSSGSEACQFLTQVSWPVGGQGPLLTILKVSWPRPLAWRTSESAGGVVPELFSKQGTSVAWEESEGSGQLGGLGECS